MANPDLKNLTIPQKVLLANMAACQTVADGKQMWHEIARKSGVVFYVPRVSSYTTVLKALARKELIEPLKVHSKFAWEVTLAVGVLPEIWSHCMAHCDDKYK